MTHYTETERETPDMAQTPTTRTRSTGPTLAEIGARIERERTCKWCGYTESTECARAALSGGYPCGY